jgi:hypothetical protein
MLETKTNKYYVESGDLRVIIEAECPLWAAVRALHYNQQRKPGILHVGDYCFVDERGFRKGSFASHHIKTMQAYDILAEDIVPFITKEDKDEN